MTAFGSLYLAGAVRTAFPAVWRSWLRKAKIEARDRLSAPERERRSERMNRRVLESPEFQRAKTVLLYRPVRGEARLEALEARAEGKRFAYPLCGENGRMRALRPRTPEAWRPGPFGIPEPDPARSEEIDPAEIDLVLCPCVAFDAAGGRLGMGGGYYDRFLPRCSRAFVAAAALEVQRTGQIPAEAWDIPMDAVFTEAAVYRRDRGEYEAI